MSALDCRSSMCEFALDRSGQRTQGGCRCLSSLDRLTPDDRAMLRQHLDALKKRLHRAMMLLDAVEETLEDDGAKLLVCLGPSVRNFVAVLDELRGTPGGEP